MIFRCDLTASAYSSQRRLHSTQAALIITPTIASSEWIRQQNSSCFEFLLPAYQAQWNCSLASWGKYALGFADSVLDIESQVRWYSLCQRSKPGTKICLSEAPREGAVLAALLAVKGSLRRAQRRRPL